MRSELLLHEHHPSALHEHNGRVQRSIEDGDPERVPCRIRTSSVEIALDDYRNALKKFYRQYAEQSE